MGSARGLIGAVAFGACMAAPSLALATDIVNGWSVVTNITKVHSENTNTLLKLNGVTQGCGHADFWLLPLDESARSKAKLSMLLLAHVSGKKVTLRCENSAVSDFEIVE